MILSRCNATSPVSKQVIYSALGKASKAFDNRVQPIENWLAPYYQHVHYLFLPINPAGVGDRKKSNGS